MAECFGTFTPEVVLEFEGEEKEYYLKYVAEGAANVVYEIVKGGGQPVDDSDFQTQWSDPLLLDPQLKGKLIRLRKTSTAVSVEESHQNFQRIIKPLFHSAYWLVEQDLCYVTPKTIQNLNGGLKDKEESTYSARPPKRHGVYLAENETCGILMTDMRSDEEYDAFEFKPKWLVQSPTAPEGSKRCRTCALRDMRAVTHHEPMNSQKDFCPLTLVSDDEEVFQATMETIVGPAAGDFDTTIAEAISGTLRKLRKIQVEKDPHGVLNTDPSKLDFMTAMTFRDCTVFVKYPRDTGEERYVEYREDGEYPDEPEAYARLGDLDLKSPDGEKAQYWKDIETQLIEEGWYIASEKNPAEAGNSICILSRGD